MTLSWGCTQETGVKHLPNTHKALDSIPEPQKKKEKEEEQIKNEKMQVLILVPSLSRSSQWLSKSPSICPPQFLHQWNEDWLGLPHVPRQQDVLRFYEPVIRKCFSLDSTRKQMASSKGVMKENLIQGMYTECIETTEIMQNLRVNNREPHLPIIFPQPRET